MRTYLEIRVPVKDSSSSLSDLLVVCDGLLAFRFVSHVLVFLSRTRVLEPCIGKIRPQGLEIYRG